MMQHRILVVDDNFAAAESLGRLLEFRGHDVVRSCTGIDAIDMTHTYRPDIVILDIGLPDMDGYEVAKNLRNEDVSSALIALTGFGQEEDKRRAKDAGFDFHLTKPVGLADIEAIFEQLEEKSV